METNVEFVASSKFLDGVRFMDASRALLLSACLIPPQFPKSCYSTCHIECLRPMHGALNVDEKIN